MKIAFQNVAAADQNNPWTKKMNDLLMKNLDLFRSEETEILIQTPTRGLTSFDYFEYQGLRSFRNSELLLEMKRAEDTGCDAIILGCYADTNLVGIRQIIDIPVVFVGETSMLFACTMGAQFGIVVPSAIGIQDIKQNISSYGIANRSLPPVSLGMEGNDQMAAIFNGKKQIEKFKDVAQPLIKSGAEVLIPGCVIMNLVLRLAPGCEETTGPLLEVEGAPVIDIVSVALKTAELMGSLKEKGSPWISRKGMYKGPSKEMFDEALKGFV